MLSNPELDQVIDVCQALVGSRLQEIMSDEKNLGLGFYHHDRVLWIWFDLSATDPMMVPLVQSPFKIKKKNPLSLFLNAHFKSHRLLSLNRNKDYGRVVELTLGSPEALRKIEVRLFRTQVNALAYADGKKISLRPPKDLEKFTEDSALRESRPVDQIIEDWMISRQYKASLSSKSAEKNDGKVAAPAIDKQKKKLMVAIEKVKEEIEKKKHSPYRALGEWLVENQSLNVPQEYNLLIDGKKPLSWNITNAFKQAKSVEAKLEGTVSRLRLLEENLNNFDQEQSNKKALKSNEKSIQPEGFRGRTFKIDDLRAVAGRSAQDNMKLLRQARAWDYWLHAKDRPGMHVIVYRNRQRKISQAEWKAILDWFAQMFWAQKTPHAIEVLCAECRNVKPIKGDKLGRVIFQNEQVLRWKP